MAAHTANPITYEAIKAFVETTATPLSPRDVELIKRLDKIYLGVMNKNG